MKFAFIASLSLLASTAWALPKVPAAAPAPKAVKNLAFDSPIVNYPVLAIKKKPAPAGFAPSAVVSDVQFLHGVASGDPLENAVIIWTKVTSTAAEVPVTYQVSTSDSFATLVSTGTVTTTADVDYTVKIDVTGLQPATTYYYRFLGGNSVMSAAGKTHTIPVATADLASYKLAVVSCSNLPAGFFNAYASIGKRTDVDIVLHLGDYIYEYQNGKYGDGTKMGRVPQPNKELATLADYRTRHAQYKTDVDLQSAHLVHPWVTVWDDHEFADNSWIGGNEGSPPIAPWEERKLAAMRAYFEYMPIRAALIDGVGRIYRNFAIGKLFDLTMLDTRMSGRDKTDPNIFDSATINSPTRTILGFPQETWFNEQLSTSQTRGAKWRIVGNQVTFATARVLWNKVLILNDSWDAYPAARNRVLNHITSNHIDNVVLLTGDIHTSLAFNVPQNPSDYDKKTGRGSVLVEFVGPSVTSQSITGPGAWALQKALPHLLFANGSKHGYMVVTITQEKVSTQYVLLDTIDRRGPSELVEKTLETLSGSGRITNQF
ncbi:hypothetical protein HDU86_007735 [Geranomyces michiganensis]|nr:hypothetical protein HDU86_007735 [Geranomyces michiganensis]